MFASNADRVVVLPPPRGRRLLGRASRAGFCLRPRVVREKLTYYLGILYRKRRVVQGVGACALSQKKPAPNKLRLLDSG